MPQGQAVDLRERQFVVRLKDYFDQERRQGPSVSTQDAVGRVAQALGLGKRTVKEILRTYRQTGQVATATLESKGKPPYRIQPALETVIRQRIRELNRQGSHVSVRSLAHWLSENYEEVPRATLGRTLQRMGLVYGKSRNTSAARSWCFKQNGAPGIITGRWTSRIFAAGFAPTYCRIFRRPL